MQRFRDPPFPSSHAATVIYAGFFGSEEPANLGGSIFVGRNEILLLGKALKFGVIFQKHELNLIKIRKLIEKVQEQMQIFPNFVIFGGFGKNNEYNINKL